MPHEFQRSKTSLESYRKKINRVRVEWPARPCLFFRDPVQAAPSRSGAAVGPFLSLSQPSYAGIETRRVAVALRERHRDPRGSPLDPESETRPQTHEAGSIPAFVTGSGYTRDDKRRQPLTKAVNNANQLSMASKNVLKSQEILWSYIRRPRRFSI